MSNDGLVAVVVESNRNANGMSLGSTPPLRHDVNMDTTTPTVPSTPSTIPGPSLGTPTRTVGTVRSRHRDRRRGRRLTGDCHKTVLRVVLPTLHPFPDRTIRKPAVDHASLVRFSPTALGVDVVASGRKHSTHVLE